MEALFQSQKEYLSAVYEVIAPMLREPLMDGAYDKALARLGGFRCRYVCCRRMKACAKTYFSNAREY